MFSTGFDPKLPRSTAGWLSPRAVQFQCCGPLPEEELGGPVVDGKIASVCVCVYIYINYLISIYIYM